MRLPAGWRPSVAGLISRPNSSLRHGLVVDPASNQMRYCPRRWWHSPGIGGGSAPLAKGSASVDPAFWPALPFGSGIGCRCNGLGSGSTAGLALNSAAEQVPQQKAILGNLEGALDRFHPTPAQTGKRPVHFGTKNTRVPF